MAPRMKRGLSQSACEADVIHNHGLWTMPNVYAGDVARHARCAYVLSPHGMLDSWALGWHARRKQTLARFRSSRWALNSQCWSSPVPRTAAELSSF
jgi:hypothetical protein